MSDIDISVNISFNRNIRRELGIEVEFPGDIFLNALKIREIVRELVDMMISNVSDIMLERLVNKRNYKGVRMKSKVVDIWFFTKSNPLSTRVSFPGDAFVSALEVRKTMKRALDTMLSATPDKVKDWLIEEERVRNDNGRGDKEIGSIESRIANNRYMGWFQISSLSKNKC